MDILIVEDSQKERELLNEFVTQLGHETRTCSTAAETLKFCQTEEPSVILLDLGLPDMDGIELCRQIRALPQGEDILIVAVTGRNEPQTVQESLEAGMDDYVCKPVTLDALRIRLFIIERQWQSLLRRRTAEQAFQYSAVQIERAKREWESTVDSLPHIISVVDRNGLLLRANRAVETWNLGRVEDVRGQNVHAFLHPHCQTPDCNLHEFLRNALEPVAQGLPVDCEIEDAQFQRPLHIQVRPIQAHQSNGEIDGIDGNESFIVIVIDDISGQRQLQEALSQQDRLLLGVAGAMDHLLITSDFDIAVSSALRTLGLAVNADRVYLFESHEHPETEEPLMSQRYGWDKFTDNEDADTKTFQNIAYRETGLQRWYDLLSTNCPVSGLVTELPEDEQEFLAPQNIMSILLVPIMIQEHFWGFIGFDDCHSNRRWRDEEELVLFAVAGSLGGSLARQQVEEQLLQTSTELRAVFQSLPDEYFRLSANGDILDYKVDKGGDLYLYSETFMGKWASGLLPDKVERQFDAAMAHVRKTKKLISIEYRVPTSAPKKRYEEIRILPFMEDQLIVVTRDITDRKLSEEELRRHRDHLEERVQERTTALTDANAKLQQLNRQLEEASQHKSHFVANMSHELRTPLNAMLGYTALTLSELQGTLSPKHLENLQKVNHAARVLMQLINDVLDFSKIEAGQMEVFVEKLNVLDVVDEVLLIAEGLLLNRPVEIRSDIADDLPEITTDYSKMKQILNNLLGNAIKFTQTGYVAMRVVSNQAKDRVRIEIEDTGEGIPDDKVGQIFESFKQVDKSIHRRFGGTGLGLTITKTFCDMLGIALGVQSQVGKGTTFWLEFPVTLQAKNGLSENEADTANADSDDVTGTAYQSILIVDDDDVNRQLLEDIFASAGHTVYVAQTATEGLTLAAQQKPDVILMDLIMEDIDGFEATKRLKLESRTAKIPVIACSAVATKEFQTKASNAGCIGYISKPVEPERLKALVQKYVRNA